MQRCGEVVQERLQVRAVEQQVIEPLVCGALLGLSHTYILSRHGSRTGGRSAPDQRQISAQGAPVRRGRRPGSRRL
ncbi:hypothetical protein ACFFX0_09855 [Citricoccus parietis]|uniref:Uncharacterized protein n=1 Tax=Citricoccus parietis TaxID=592307 RepID=A0ABV5FXR4_9MICC